MPCRASIEVDALLQLLPSCAPALVEVQVRFDR
jgi:hypothetical protein